MTTCCFISFFKLNVKIGWRFESAVFKQSLAPIFGAIENRVDDVQVDIVLLEREGAIQKQADLKRKAVYKYSLVINKNNTSLFA